MTCRTDLLLAWIRWATGARRYLTRLAAWSPPRTRLDTLQLRCLTWRDARLPMSTRWDFGPVPYSMPLTAILPARTPWAFSLHRSSTLSTVLWLPWMRWEDLVPSSSTRPIGGPPMWMRWAAAGVLVLTRRTALSP